MAFQIHVAEFPPVVCMERKFDCRNLSGEEFLMNEILRFISKTLKQMAHLGNFPSSINGEAQLGLEKWMREAEKRKDERGKARYFVKVISMRGCLSYDGICDILCLTRDAPERHAQRSSTNGGDVHKSLLSASGHEH